MSDVTIVLLYIDPGVGFLALQMLIGSFLGLSFYFRRTVLRCLERVRALVGGKRSPTPDPDDEG